MFYFRICLVGDRLISSEKSNDCSNTTMYNLYCPNHDTNQSDSDTINLDCKYFHDVNGIREIHGFPGMASGVINGEFLEIYHLDLSFLVNCLKSILYFDYIGGTTH